MLGLEALELAEAPVVLGIADLGGILYVVEAEVPVQILDQRADASLGVPAGRHG
jgi:hypothetical protein